MLTDNCVGHVVTVPNITITYIQGILTHRCCTTTSSGRYGGKSSLGLWLSCVTCMYISICGILLLFYMTLCAHMYRGVVVNIPACMEEGICFVVAGCFAATCH